MKTKKLLSSLIVGASMLASFSAMSEKFVVFSPSSNQTDYTSMFNSNYNASWQGIDNAYDALNLHAAELKFQPDSYFTDIKDRIGNKPIILELQSTDGINSLIDQFPKTYGPFTDETHQDAVKRASGNACNRDASATTATLCGQVAADRWFNGIDANEHWHGLRLHRLKDAGLNVQYIMLDSTFYASYFEFGYAWQKDLGWHTHQGKMKTLYFMDGFIQRMKHHFGANLKFIYLSHFKYEYVNNHPGIISADFADNGTITPRVGSCFNTCTPSTHVPWTNEEDILEFVINGLPGRFSKVMFDAAWSSYGVTDYSRMDTMITKVKSLSNNNIELDIGNMIITDALFTGDNCGHHECFRDIDEATCDLEDKWTNHSKHFTNVINDGHANYMNKNKSVDSVFIGSWHKFPREVFKQSGKTCSESTEDHSMERVLKCSAATLGKTGVTCPSIDL